MSKREEREEIVDAEIVDEETEGDVPESLGTIDTPDLPVTYEQPEVRTELRRLDALRLGDTVVAPVEGIVTALRMLPSGVVQVFFGGDVSWQAMMNEAVEAVVPHWRPGDLLPDDTGLDALREVRRVPVDATR